MITTYGLTIAAFVFLAVVVALASYWDMRQCDRHRADVERRIRELRRPR